MYSPICALSASVARLDSYDRRMVEEYTSFTWWLGSEISLLVGPTILGEPANTYKRTDSSEWLSSSIRKSSEDVVLGGYKWKYCTRCEWKCYLGLLSVMAIVTTILTSCS